MARMKLFSSHQARGTDRFLEGKRGKLKAKGTILLIVFCMLFSFTIQAKAEIPEYSCTWINHFDTAPDLPDCDDDTDTTIGWLTSRGYDRRFVWSERWVWNIDFDIYNSGYEGLDEADFHIHSGHGGVGTILLANGTHVTGWDVFDHWDWDSEWVFLYTCLTLSDHSVWAGAMKTGTHGLFGFVSTCQGTYGALPDGFFKRAIDWSWTPVQAYYGATRDNNSYPGSSTAIFITDTYSQWYNDHMWYNDGGLSTDSDEYPDDDTYWYATWDTY